MQATAEAAATLEPPESKPPDDDGMVIRRITVAEYYRMGEAGIFGPEERVELLDGLLIEMPPASPPHAYSVGRVTSAFYMRFDGRAYIRSQAAMTLDRWSEPEPDVMLSVLPEEQYAVAHPKPSQVLLVVEVAVSSLRYDAGASCARTRAGDCASTGSSTSSAATSTCIAGRVASVTRNMSGSNAGAPSRRSRSLTMQSR
jgi:hypothetical protein